MFVDRDSDGTITGSYVSAQREGQEEVADDAAELLAFLDRPRRQSEATASSRALLARRADSLAASDSIDDKLEALKIRLELLGG